MKGSSPTNPAPDANVSGRRNGRRPKKPAARTWTTNRMRKIGSVAWSGSAADGIGAEDRTRAPALARDRPVDWYNPPVPHRSVSAPLNAPCAGRGAPRRRTDVRAQQVVADQATEGRQRREA